MSKMKDDTDSYTHYIDLEHTIIRLSDYLEGNNMCLQHCTHALSRCYRCIDGSCFDAIDDSIIVKVKSKK